MQKLSASLVGCLCLLIGCATASAQQNETRDRFLIQENNLFGFIDRTGNVVIKPQFTYADEFHEGLASVRLGDQAGYINEAGEMVITLPPNSGGRRFSDGLAGVNYGGKQGYIDKTGKLVIEGKFTGSWDFSDGMARVKLYDKFTFVDKSGKILTDPVFDDAHDFSGGLAWVRVGSRWGYIDKQGRYVWRSQ
jgi:hypothetical protein